jgi:acetolactate synthase I/III small subunit
MKHTLSCLVKNESGVIAKVSEAFASQGISLSSLAVGETQDTEVSRVTISVEGDNKVLAAVEEQCEALDVVLELENLTSEEFYARELLLVKIRVEVKNITRVMQVAELFQARVIGLSDHAITLELAGEQRAIDGLLKMVRPMGIAAMARSGQIAVPAGDDEEVEGGEAP